MIQAHGQMQWQKLSGYNRRSRIEAELSRFKRVIGERSRRWRAEHKLAIFSEAFSPSAIVSEVARQYEISTSLI